MLALTRKAGERIVIGHLNAPIGEIEVNWARDGKVRLAFEFDRSIPIIRPELVSKGEPWRKTASAAGDVAWRNTHAVDHKVRTAALMTLRALDANGVDDHPSLDELDQELHAATDAVIAHVLEYDEQARRTVLDLVVVHGAPGNAHNRPTADGVVREVILEFSMVTGAIIAEGRERTAEVTT